jgi:hypothetical protein
MTKTTPFQTRAALKTDFNPLTAYTGAASGAVRPGDIASTVLGEEINFGVLFAYCFRRFGFPNQGGYGFDDIASYQLTTPIPDVFLQVYIKATIRTSLLFGFTMSCDIEEQLHQEHRDCNKKYHADFLAWRQAKGVALPSDLSSDFNSEAQAIQFEKLIKLYCAEGGSRFKDMRKGPATEAVLAALRVTLEDIRNPVMVRDNAFSVVNLNCELNPTDDEDNTETVDKANHLIHPSAGCFLPSELTHNPDVLIKLLALLEETGGGDLAKGVDALISERSGQYLAP